MLVKHLEGGLKLYCLGKATSGGTSTLFSAVTPELAHARFVIHGLMQESHYFPLRA